MRIWVQEKFLKKTHIFAGFLLKWMFLSARVCSSTKKTTEIQKTLSAVSSQYDLFESLLAKAKKKIDEAGSSIEAAQKRNTTIQRKLHNVDKMDADEAEALLNSGE